MKVDQLILEEGVKENIIIDKPYEKKRMIMSTVPFKGHTFFEIDCMTGKIEKAKFEETTADLDGATHKKVLIHENCVYISCLNKKSALKKYTKWLHEKLNPKSTNSPKD